MGSKNFEKSEATNEFCKIIDKNQTHIILKLTDRNSRDIKKFILNFSIMCLKYNRD